MLSKSVVVVYTHKKINETIEPLLNELNSHIIYKSMHSIDDLRGFMSIHVFAVWDFMNYVKALQKEFTSTGVPFIIKDPKISRFINEINIDEETDKEVDGCGHISHVSLYLRAMKEISADSSKFDEFYNKIVRSGSLDYEEIFRELNLPNCLQEFLLHNRNIVESDDKIKIASQFLYGREKIIPNMFKNIIDDFKLDKKESETFIYYMERHIEVDGDSHGPLSEELIDILIDDDEYNYHTVLYNAQEAILTRIKLWDCIVDNGMNDMEFNRVYTEL